MDSEGRKTILLVEDEPLIAMGEKVALERYGYRVVTASSGERALELYPADPSLDLVLMDIDLGRGLDGPATATLLLELRPIPIVFLSSHGERETVEKTEAIASYGYVVKNSGITVLDASIKMAFRLFDANRRLVDTNRRLADANLRLAEGERRFEALYRHMIEGAALHEIVRDESGVPFDYRIVDTNPAFERQLGIPRASVIGKTSREAYGVPEPPYFDTYLRVATTAEPVVFETWFAAMERYFSISVYSPYADAFATIFEDITERRQAESALRESEDRFRSIVENSAAGYFRIDREGLFRDVNAAWLRLHGYGKADEILGRHFSETQVGIDREGAQAIVDRLFDGMVVPAAEFSRRCKDGSIGWHVFTVTSIRSGGEIVGLEGFLIDISERKRIEVALAESEGSLRNALSAAKAGTWSWNIDTNENHWSDELWPLYGLEKGCVAPCWDSWCATIHPDDLSNVEKAIGAAVEAGNELSNEWRVRGADRWLMSQGKPERDAAGRLVRYLGVVLDITGRKEAERAFQEASRLNQQILDSVQEGIIVYDLELRCLVWNTFMETITGKSAADVLGRKPAEVFGFLEKSGVISGLERALVGEVVVTEDFPFANEGAGRSGWATDISAPLRSQSGEIIGVIGTVVDTTAKKLAEDQASKRLVALTRPSGDGTISFEELFDLDEIQAIQDEFSDATGVASIITSPDGRPLTAPSNFTRLCRDLIRGTEKGLANCFKSDAIIGAGRVDGPVVHRCLSGGLWDAGASIDVGGHHVANWLIGQVRDEAQTEEGMRDYAMEIGADEKAFLEAYRQVPSMPRERFEKVAKAFFTLSRQLSTTAWQNVLQARHIAERRRGEERIQSLLEEKELLLREVHHRIKNNMNNIHSLLDFQSVIAGDVATTEALREAGGRVKSMMLLYDRLYLSTDHNSLSIADYLPSLVDEIVATWRGVFAGSVEKHIGDFVLEAKVLQPLGIIVNELLTNVMKYAFAGRPGGAITVSATLEGRLVRVEIRDDGVGMPEGVGPEASPGFGLRLVGALATQLGGTIRVERGLGPGQDNGTVNGQVNCSGTRVILEFGT
jgi:PAS domain S-box-containing protein